MNISFKKLLAFEKSIKNAADYKNQRIYEIYQEALATAESPAQTAAIDELHKQIVKKALEWHFLEAKKAALKPDITEHDQGWLEEQVGIINGMAKKAQLDVSGKIEEIRKAARKT